MVCGWPRGHGKFIEKCKFQGGMAVLLKFAI
jgi:hypothetical protein